MPSKNVLTTRVLNTTVKYYPVAISESYMCVLFAFGVYIHRLNIRIIGLLTARISGKPHTEAFQVKMMSILHMLKTLTFNQKLHFRSCENVGRNSCLSTFQKNTLPDTKNRP